MVLRRFQILPVPRRVNLVSQLNPIDTKLREVHLFQHHLESRVVSDLMKSRVKPPPLERDVAILHHFVKKAKAIIEIAEFGVYIRDGPIKHRLLR